MVDFEAALREPQAPQQAQRDSLDLQAVQDELQIYDPQIEAFKEKAKSIQVKDNATLEQAGELAGQARDMKKKIETARKRFVQDPNNFVKRVNNLAKKYSGAFDEVERDLKKRISAYYAEEERKHREEERRRQEEERKRQETERQAQESDGNQGQEQGQTESAPQELEPQPAGPPRSVQTGSGKMHQKLVWTFEVQDESQVPREYLAVDQKKIRQAVKDGVREIPGVNIYQEHQTAIR